MKKLIFLLMGFFCFAHGQADSAKIVQSLQKLEQVNKETKILLKRSDQLAKENTTLIYRIKMYIQKYIKNTGVHDEKPIPLNRSQGIIPENDTKPVVELHVPDGIDSIRGSFFYRLFHKDKIYLRPYKIINDEKVYLD